MSDDEGDGEDPPSNDYTGYTEYKCFFISKLWIEREKHTDTDYDMTDWMLCAIPHIREDLLKIQI